ncbi:MAG TPA: methyltransferase domain-containing protein [Anaerolineae bacterium]|nr:methyltransferase domain-containing protein [Anaerolineae bacterium]
MNDEGPFFLDIRRVAAEDGSGRAYNALYEEESLSQIESFYLWLMDRLHLPASGTLLDVSCGAGEVVRLAMKRGLKAIGVDISEVVAREAYRNSGRQASVAVSAGEHLPFPDTSFDFVTNIGSLEHFVDPALGVREMARVLRPGGKAFMLVPNTFSLLTNIWVAFRTGRTSVDHQPIQRYGARADWVRLLQSNGLTVRHTAKYERAWPRLADDRRYYLRRPKEMLRLLVAPFVPINLAFCFLFTCERSPGVPQAN